jgi:hypothetical protein
VKRWSGFAAVLRAESDVAPIPPDVEALAELELGLMVVVDE